MKTNQIVVQKIFNKNIRQQTKNGFLNLNDVLAIYNESSETKKEMKEYFKLKTTQERIETVYMHEILTRGKSTELEYHQIQSKIVDAKKGKYGGTYAHPLIFLDFCMWLSKDFWYFAMKILESKLIELRVQIGDKYNDMMGVVKTVLKPKGYTIYSREAVMVNQAVFGDEVYYSERNQRSEEEMARLQKAQEVNIKLLNMGILDRNIRKEKIKEFMRLF